MHSKKPSESGYRTISEKIFEKMQLFFNKLFTDKTKGFRSDLSWIYVFYTLTIFKSYVQKSYPN